MPPIVPSRVPGSELFSESVLDRLEQLDRASNASGVAAAIVTASRALSSDSDEAGDIDVAWTTLIGLADAGINRMMHAQQDDTSAGRLDQAETLQRALFAVADLAASEHEISRILPELHRIVGSLMHAPDMFVALHDPATDALCFIYCVDSVAPDAISVNQSVPMAQLEHGLTWHLIRDGLPLMGPTLTLREQVSATLESHGRDSRHWLGVPMRSGTEVCGGLVVQSHAVDRGFTATDQALLSFVGNHIVAAVERTQTQQELERRVAQRTQDLADAIHVLNLEVEERKRAGRLQAALFRIAELSPEEDDMDEFYVSTHSIVGSLINARNFYIALYSEDRTRLLFPYSVDEAADNPDERPLGNSVIEYLLRIGKPLLASAADLARLHESGAFNTSDTTAQSWLGVPLLAGDSVLGAIVVQSYSPDVRYGWREQELLTFVSYQIASSLQRRNAARILRAANASLEQRVAERTRELSEQIAVREQIELRLKHEVMHDTLTGLPNRGYMRDRLERVLGRARRTHRQTFAVLYCDIDRFKVINDSLGHLAGDIVLKEVGRRLSSCLRSQDVVARLGGDEFAILIDDISGTDIPVRIAQRIIELVAEPLMVLGKEVMTSTSVGVAMGEQRHRHADDVLRDADAAMYRAKQRGRHRFEIFDESLNQEALDVLAMEAEVRHAIVDREFLPHFQPIVRLADGCVVGHEALLRWQHPTRGLLAPGEFIRFAEGNGCIEAIDWALFEAACSLVARKPDSGYVTVNVSPAHFSRPDLDERLLAMIARCGIAPSRVHIELTEGSLLDNPELTRQTLERLRDAGVTAAVDDFGTGFSSLSYIHRFPLKILKIDRSFVAEIGTPREYGSIAVIRAILTLAHSLNMDVIAEGIETETQRSVLLGLGCGFGQGYLLGRPAPLR